MSSNKAVILLHGINTRGTWQKDLTPSLCKAGMIVYPLDYGYMSPVDLLFQSRRDDKVEWARSEFEAVRRDSGDRAPHIIAHSFGTYLVGRLVKDFPGQIFSTVILSGSILSENFDWDTSFRSGKVGWVMNDFGRLDIWPRVASRLIPDAGCAGSSGFTAEHPFLSQRAYEGYGHSSYFSADHYRNEWVSALSENRRGLCEQLRNVRSDIANLLRISFDDIITRAYKQVDNALVSIPGLTLSRQYELQSIPFGSGASSVLLHGSLIHAFNGEKVLLYAINRNTQFDPCIDVVEDGVRYRICAPLYGGSIEGMPCVGVIVFDLKGSMEAADVTPIAESLMFSKFTI